MNICVVMYYDDCIKNYAEINYNINKKYCEKYKFEIILSNKKILNEIKKIKIFSTYPPVVKLEK